jgi:hypothetical protein
MIQLQMATTTTTTTSVEAIDDGVRWQAAAAAAAPEPTAGAVTGSESGPYGQRLVVHLADELARNTPERIYATITNSPHDVSHGYRDITIKQFANAVNHAAWDLKAQFGVSPPGAFDVIAYIGTPDIRYAIYFMAAIKTGHQVRSWCPASLQRDQRALELTRNGRS